MLSHSYLESTPDLWRRETEVYDGNENQQNLLLKNRVVFKGLAPVQPRLPDNHMVLQVEKQKEKSVSAVYIIYRDIYQGMEKNFPLAGQTKLKFSQPVIVMM